MAAQVGQVLEVLWQRLRGLAEHDPAVVDAGGEVPALLVAGGAAHGFDRERCPGLREPAGNTRVGDGAEVVGVGHEHTLEAGVDQLVEQAGAAEGGVDVTVTGRTPLERRVDRPAHRLEVVDPELRLLVLQELQRQPFDREVLVARQRREGVGGGVERVHEDQRERGAVLLAQVEHLAGDDVEERQAASYAQQGLGAIHAHGGAEAAVELDHHGGPDRVGGRLVGHLDVGEGLHLDRLDGGLGDHSRLPVLDQPVVVREDVDRRLVDAGIRHLLAAHLQALVAHLSPGRRERSERFVRWFSCSDRRLAG